MHPKIWKASGHVDAFNDPLIDNKDSKKRYRADELVESYINKLKQKINKELKKAAKNFGNAFDEKKFLTTSPRIIKSQSEIQTISKQLNSFLEKEDLKSLKELIENLQILRLCLPKDQLSYNLFHEKSIHLLDQLLLYFLYQRNFL